MTHEISSPMNAPEHREQHDRIAANGDSRRRQLDIFRQRQHEADLEESR